MIDEAIKNYEEKLDCDEERKKQFIQKLNRFRDFVPRESSENDVKQINRYYLLSGYKEDDMQLVKQLFEEKNEDGNFRFDAYYISFILQVEPENRDVLETLINAKDNDGEFRFDGDDISSILCRVTPENKDSLLDLINAKNSDGQFRFNAYKIQSILGNVTPENKDLLPELINAKDNEGNFRFDEYYISSILYRVTPENKDSLLDLINAKNSDGQFRFNTRDITSILYRVTPENKNLFLDILPELIYAKDNEGNFRFNGNNISLILYRVTPENKDLLPELINAKDNEGNFRFDADNISSILYHVTPEKKEILKTLINLKGSDDKFRFNGDDIINIFSSVAPKNKDLLPDLINAKNSDGQFRFSARSISNIIILVTPKNKDLLHNLINEKDNEGNFRFNGNNISLILKYFTPENKDIFPDLINAKDNDGQFRFNANNIMVILKNFTPENSDILETLINSKDNEGNFRFDENKINFILQYFTPENKDLIHNLINEKDNEGNFRFNGNNISAILEYFAPENKEILKTLINLKGNDNKFRFSGDDITSIFSLVKPENKDTLFNLLDNYNKLELTPNYIISILNPNNNISLKDIKTLEHIIGKNETKSLNAEEIQTAYNFKGLLNKQNINEISQRRKKEIVRKLVRSNTGVFNISDKLRKYLPLLPKNQEEYCTFLPALVKSIGIETNELSQSDISKVEKELTSLSDTLKSISDDDFKNLKIEQEYTTEDLIKNTYEIVKKLPEEERQKVYDYFGFELKINSAGTTVDDNITKKFSITGYPVNLNNGKKLAQIDKAETKAVVEQLRPYIIKYSENNPIISNNKQVEIILNEILEKFPELRNSIGKTQHSKHDYDLLKHSLKVMQKITQNPQFDKLNISDKKLMLLASLFHDITKPEGLVDETHSRESAFDTYYILKKINLSKQEEIKLYTLIKNHEWLKYVNKKNVSDSEKRLQSAAFDLQYDNLFEMSKIFTVADLKAVKEDDGYYLKYKEDFETCSKSIENYIKELKTSQPVMPVTPLPKASKINTAITTVNFDGSTNIKGVYKNKDGLVIIKYNEVKNDDWEKIGFPKGSISRGIDTKGLSSKHGELKAIEEVNTGNIKFFVHGLDYSNQLSKFNAFALPDSDALLSVSYAERPESKYRFFRPQGVILNTPTKYMHGGGETDAGPGNAKNLDLFKKDYIFGGYRESDRKYISNLIKNALDLTDEEYLEFVKENADKPFTSIEPEEVRNTLIKAFSTINSNTRIGNRAYNEMYITNPEVMGVFAYPEDDHVGNIIQFIDKQPGFLKQYALDNDLPFLVFGY